MSGNIQLLDRLEKPRRLSDLALNCAIFVLDCIVPTDIERGAITVPDYIKERAAERGLGRRRKSYDQLKSPPPGMVVMGVEEASGEEGVVGRVASVNVK
jgi:hypothetical protein